MVRLRKLHVSEPTAGTWDNQNFEHFSLSVLTKLVVIRDGIHKMLVRIANNEDPEGAV